MRTAAVLTTALLPDERRRSRRRAFVLALAVAAGLAGCLTPYAERLRAQDVEEPRWNVGDWWTYAIQSETIDLGGEVTIVVAERLANGYVLGIPADAEANAALLYHMPPIGPIASDLSWDVHETRFEPARWPLSDGLEWDTTWISADVHLTARHNGTTWSINNSGHEQDAGMRYDLVYDPGVKWFTSFVRTGLDGRVRQAMELTASGTNYTGTLRAPQFIEISLLESRTGGVLRGGTPAAPNPTFTPPAGADTLLVGCLVGGAPGQYHAEVRLGDGVICQLDETIQPGDATTRAQVVEIEAGEGPYEARLLGAGAGAATVEVLAWPTLNYTLGG